jgi:hypothetical protein
LRFGTASRTRACLQQLSDRKWRGLYSINYVYSNGAYQRELYSYGISALAEWSWNLRGRSAKEFAAAWATRQGYERPGEVAEWVDLMEPVEVDLGWALNRPVSYWSPVFETIRKKQPAVFGKGALTSFPDTTRLDQDRAACQQAHKVAEATGRQELILETEYAASLTDLAKALCGISDLALKSDLTQDANRKALRAALDEFRSTVGKLTSTMDRKTDLLRSEPKSFAETIKREHRERWLNISDEMTSVTSELLKR